MESVYRRLSCCKQSQYCICTKSCSSDAGFNQQRPIVPPKPRTAKRRRSKDFTERLREDAQVHPLDEDVDQTNSEEGEFADLLDDENPSQSASQSASQSTSRSSSATPYQRGFLRPKRSNIWEYFTVQGIYSRCNYCGQEYKINGGTGRPRAHLAKDHSIVLATPKEDRCAQYNKDIKDLFSRQPELAKQVLERRLEAF